MERVQRVNQLIKKELSQIILKGISFSEGILVTVTRVETSGNLIQAKIYVSVMPEDETDNIMQILDNSIYNLQQRLNKRLKMRPIPRIIFVKEEKTREAGRVEELLEKIHKKNV